VVHYKINFISIVGSFTKVRPVGIGFKILCGILCKCGFAKSFSGAYSFVVFPSISFQSNQQACWSARKPRVKSLPNEIKIACHGWFRGIILTRFVPNKRV